MRHSPEIVASIQATEKATEISKLAEDFKENTSIQSIKRCTPAGVGEFIASEASSYSCKNIGTIHNSIAKKAVDADLRTEKKEIEVGIQTDTPEVRSSYEMYPSEVSLEKIKDLLTTHINKWTFQTNNANELITFYAKSSSESKLEIFINLKKDGDRSHISLGSYFGYINPEVLGILRSKLENVFTKITEEAKRNVILTKDSVFGDTQWEGIKLEDPDVWHNLKEIALQEFTSEEETLLEKVLHFFSVEANISVYQMLKRDTLDDRDITNYFLDNIKMDIKQIYA